MPTLTTAEAAARLGVKPETLYAYVSRGLLTSTRGTGGRASTFDADEVDALAAGRGRRPPGVAESITTRLTLVEADDVVVRGRRLVDLARHETPDRMAALLWLGSLDSELPDAAPDDGVVAAVRSLVDAMPGDPRPVDRLRLAVAALAPADPWRFDLEAAVPTGLRCLRGMVASLGGLWPAISDRPEDPEVLRCALVLLADHGLAASTLAARVAASARAHPYAVVSAGLGALDGPVHGTASTSAYRFLTEALDDPARAVTERLRAGERLPGFGHSIYVERDPRTDVLLETIAGTREAALVGELAAQVSGRPGVFPNVDLALAAVMHVHGMRPDAGEAIFAVARTVGWIAHAIEQYAEPGLRFRVAGSYVGQRP
ncbi:citrate synthase [Actinomycetospora termitidis]|uniref:citrate synthase (unknown stereospecificity) n=1 Tax=Actinomycetospora termitidis TaxID=3053470 RepID=A0ABT7MLS7_9PSEU|nr:citrate synthase [Actinomycetospora sp. Odt1-22]MDL5160603.1 citrate synthase [Actinomycetospora sp. Odt1-22]